MPFPTNIEAPKAEESIERRVGWGYFWQCETAHRPAAGARFNSFLLCRYSEYYYYLILHIALFVINCRLCVPEIIKFAQSI